MSSVAHRNPLSRSFSGRAVPRARQGGFAFMVVLVGLVLGSLTFYLENLNASISPARQADKTRDALAEAKEILIAWAAESEIDNNGPGHFPCPDNTGDGHSQGNGCGAVSRLGRFPWKTLNAPDLRDASGERLWYAISPNFLNKKTNPVNSDTRGSFRITGATEQDDVIAIIFAPGSPLAGQDRSSDVARKNRANYLEDPNLDDDEFPSEFNEESNDRMAFVTAADLYSAVERKVAERTQINVVPVLHYYLNAWKDANAEAEGIMEPAWVNMLEAADKLLPFPAPFNPSSVDTACGQPNLSKGQLPLGYCGQLKAVYWRAQSGYCEDINDEAKRPENSMAAIRCTVALSASSDDDDDDDECDDDDKEFVTRSVRFDVLLADAGRRSLAMPLHKARTQHTGETTPQLINIGGQEVENFAVYSARLNNGDIGLRYDGEYRFDRCAPKAKRTTTIVLPIYRLDNQFMYVQGTAIDAEIDADDNLTNPQKDDLKKERKDKVDPDWFFRNGWHRLTYYVASSETLPCTSCPGNLLLQRANGLTSHGALLVLAGQSILYADAEEQKRMQVRPSTALTDYFELQNHDPSAQLFQQTDSLKALNDRVVSVCPWTPNPYQPEVTQACPQ